MPKNSPFNSFASEYDSWFDKENLIYKLELKVINKLLPEAGKGIEIGSGTGRFSIPIGIKIGVEPSFPMAKIAVQKGLAVIGGIAESLPVKSESFDFVLFNTVICFLDSPQAAFLESYRILRPGGSIMVGFINRDSYLGNIYNKEKDKSKFYRSAKFFSVSDVINLLSESGYDSNEYAQTLIFDKKDNSLSEKISAGYAEGSYVLIKGYKRLNN